MIISLNKKITCSLCERTYSEDYFTLAQTLEKNPVCESCQQIEAYEATRSVSIGYRLTEVAILAAIAGFIALPWLAQ